MASAPTRRSTRQAARRTSAEQQARDEEYIADEIEVLEVSTKRARPARPKKSKWEDADKVLTATRSPLVSTDIRDLLRHPEAWSCLTPEERSTVLAHFPSDIHILDPGTTEARPNIESLSNDDSFRNDCVQYTKDLRAGKHDPEWLAEAWAAHQQRGAGEFAAYLERKVAEEWQVSAWGLKAASDIVRSSGVGGDGKQLASETERKSASELQGGDGSGMDEGRSRMGRSRSEVREKGKVAEAGTSKEGRPAEASF